MAVAYDDPTRVAAGVVDDYIFVFNNDGASWYGADVPYGNWGAVARIFFPGWGKPMWFGARYNGDIYYERWKPEYEWVYQWLRYQPWTGLVGPRKFLGEGIDLLNVGTSFGNCVYRMAYKDPSHEICKSMLDGT